ncbi:hypothetical protein Q1W73_08545 [Asticcacaulis sp. ZE23SCel15]|uniref:hypothetical protein n=1 Tax=Asticcacaulis sp. ZE23SCel15 TaxID=3059027 RepID=UPI00265F42E5|nr:hypothetical protein [Asticcacaulis sp. ZE23SCel15]WKL55757.1 hypothetical protein Q1W73_08545 [Asticcacaulis sp. ZE23SCel15]
MSEDVKFDKAAQRDLMGAAARLYEANMIDVCMSILSILIKHDNDDAHILYGHCISYEEYKYSDDIANKHYEIACEMGNATGCYNLHLNYLKHNDARAGELLNRAVELGWEDFD